MTLAMLFLVKVDDGAALASPVMGEVDDPEAPRASHRWKYQTVQGIKPAEREWFRNGAVSHEVVRWPG